MLGVWDEIHVDLQQVCAIAHRRKVLDLLPENSTGFDHPSSTDKAFGPCQRWSPPLSRANIWTFFADKAAEFIDFDEGAGLCLRWVYWECLGNLHQPARESLGMDLENPADSLASPSLLDRADRPAA